MWERLRGRYYEGPTPPKRLSAAARTFAAVRPNASAAQWVEFVTDLAEESYRSGYVRGLEWCERDLERRDPVVDPEVLAANERHDMSWVGLEPDENDTAAIRKQYEDIYDHLPPEQRMLYMDTLGQHMGTFRIEVDDENSG